MRMDNNHQFSYSVIIVALTESSVCPQGDCIPESSITVTQEPLLDHHHHFLGRLIMGQFNHLLKVYFQFACMPRKVIVISLSCEISFL